MGVGWRRFSEKAKQNWKMTTEKEFAATSNGRNESMLKEAGDFAGHLKRCEQDIRTVKNSTEGLLNTTKIVMSAPLPRVYEDAGNGKVQPIVAGTGPAAITIGGEFKVDDLTKVAKDTAKKMEAEVLAPMQRWTTAYNTVLARMRRLEGVRLEVDSRRRTVTALGQKIDKQRAKLPQTRSKGEWEMEQTIKKMQHKENKLAAARQSFKEQEALVYQQLAQLIRDAVWLKSYIAAVMRLEQEAFQSAFSALGPSKAAFQVNLHNEVPALPQTPEHSGVVGSSRAAVDTPPQANQPTSMMRSLTNKALGQRQKGSAKEVGNAGVPAKENSFIDAPAAPTHRIQQQQGGTVGRYGTVDRYGDQNQNQYGREPVPAW